MRRKKRGRPSKPGLYIDEIVPAISGKLGIKLKKMAEKLVIIDVRCKGRLPRFCEGCGGRKIRFRIEDEKLKLRIYCSECSWNTTASLDGGTPRQNVQVDNSGKSMTPPGRFKKCPKCGGKLWKDHGLGDLYCPTCGITIESLSKLEYDDANKEFLKLVHKGR